MNRQNGKPTGRAEEAARTYRENGSSTDPLGSYTGVPREIKSSQEAVFPPRRPDREQREFPPAAVQHAWEGGKVYRRAEQSPSPDMPVQDVDDL